jgi:hypothetical protein
MSALRRLACILFVLSLWVTGEAVHAEKKITEDEKLLQGLLKDFLFDPKGAERVEVAVKIREVRGSAGQVKVQGWLVKAKEGDRVYFTDGASVPAPVEQLRTKIDFVAKCKKLYADAAKKIADPDNPRDPFAKMRRNALGLADDSDLVLAAWLYRLGEKELAFKALALVSDRKKEIARVRKGLAWTAYAGMVHAYMVRADEEALDHGERLVRLFTDEAKEHFKQADAVVRDLKRRKEQGVFGKGATKELPKDFAKLETKKQISFLIDALQDVDARQMGQPGGVDLAGDFRVAALIKIGDPAVPALINVLEKDERLTRSVHFWRDFAQTRTVMSVRETALTALMSILRVRVFQPRSTGDNFTSRGDEASKEPAQKLRAYWNEFGALSFDERMMKVLKDPDSRFEDLREAADNIANLGGERTLGTTVWSNTGKERPKGPNPAVKKFTKPTAAEAILSSMKRDLAHHDDLPKGFLHDYQRRQLEDRYLFPLIELGDKRIAAELAKLAGAADSIRMRRKWAYASFHLGYPEPMKKYADDFRTGKIELPANDRPQLNDFDQPGYVELRENVRYLGGVSLPEADRALYGLADRKNPAYAQVAKAVLSDSYRFEEQGWTDHPYCLKILRDALDDEKTRDQSFKKLSKLLVGLPHNTNVKEMKAMLDRFDGRFRRGSKAVWQAEDSWGNPRFEPDIVPLDRPATAEDVKAGRAVFHLNGKGKRTDLGLPALGMPKSEPGRVNPVAVVIVQAETGPDGVVMYGFIARNAIRSAPATEFNRVTPLKDLKEEGQ